MMLILFVLKKKIAAEVPRLGAVTRMELYIGFSFLMLSAELKILNIQRVDDVPLKSCSSMQLL